ncbi:hypothetical protein GCM10009080_37660 [Cupriavidus pauculus]
MKARLSGDGAMAAGPVAAPSVAGAALPNIGAQARPAAMASKENIRIICCLGWADFRIVAPPWCGKGACYGCRRVSDMHVGRNRLFF